MSMKDRSAKGAPGSSAPVTRSSVVVTSNQTNGREVLRQSSDVKSHGRRSAGGVSQGSQLSHKLSMSLKKTLAQSSSKQSGSAAAKVHEMLNK